MKNLIIILLVLLASQGVFAAEKRIALVIGNADYANAPLINPGNDAQDMADMLRSINFDVELLLNANRKTMRSAIRRFSDRSKRADASLFYYAGHGIQVGGNNYLVPLQADVSIEAEVPDEGVSLNSVLAQMKNANSQVNIVLLDACRNNPFASNYRSVSRGLARVNGPTGFYIAFATAEGGVAADGSGRNGVFTQQLLSNLPRSGLSIHQAMTAARVGVINATKGQQIPWSSESLLKEFWFVGGEQTSHSSTAAAIPAVAAQSGLATLTVRSNVNDDEVFINGRSHGKTPLNVDLSFGTHLVEVKKQGYTSHTHVAELRDSTAKTVWAKLEEKPDVIQQFSEELEALDSRYQVSENLGNAVTQGKDKAGKLVSALLKWLGIFVASLVALIVILIVTGGAKKIINFIND